jgi:hypothetical protein
MQMLNPQSYAFCREFYIVEKTIEVVVSIGGELNRIRIDALHGPGATIAYSTKAYIEEDITVQPTWPQSNGQFAQPPKSVSVWIDYDLPWTDRSSADDAIAQALGFLRQRCDP